MSKLAKPLALHFIQYGGTNAVNHLQLTQSNGRGLVFQQEYEQIVRELNAFDDLLAACKLTKAMFAKCDLEGDMECPVPLDASEWQEWESVVNAAIDKAEKQS